MAAAPFSFRAGDDTRSDTAVSQRYSETFAADPTPEDISVCAVSLLRACGSWSCGCNHPRKLPAAAMPKQVFQQFQRLTDMLSLDFVRHNFLSRICC
ncbi:hypothetical protein HKX05_12685 [Sphingomonas sanguinis]|jgi:hypothetical protein|uniref:Uncharacterized protein n=2 Tax=Sphingomonas sanguinis TaxID=33051 RepID=A0A7Y7QXQ4_9SPHN|nr:hypothetical protein [Sphingomonas sanguinis]NNG48567.1 hypothetical protein [Sphingomonas sanguinis]NNG54210.1 hypothetical protein [Sphingomonas sanguinis]NVP32649.1 hypothetical protein [Sphingomonas sanguinis]